MPLLAVNSWARDDIWNIIVTTFDLSVTDSSEGTVTPIVTNVTFESDA
jgi:hypothetical protein